MAKYKHFVITLFNLRRIWITDKKNNFVGTDEWLTERFGLFDKYSYSSITNQVDKDFIWLCLFDKDTPPKYIEKIKEYEAKTPQMVACYFSYDDMSDWVGRLKNIIKGYMDDDDEYLITTNLDTDDLIHKNMTNRIKQEFENGRKEGVYSMLYGYQYFPFNGLLLKMRYPHSHFLSVVEKYTPDFRTVKHASHGRMRKHFTPIDIKDESYWVEFVHNTNVNNDLRMTSRIRYSLVFKTVSFKDFGLDVTLSKKDNIKNTLAVLPGLFVKTAIHKIKRKIKQQINK